MRAYCIHKNLRESEEGDTPYKKRHGNEKPGVDLMPFGCLVDLLPIADKPRRPREGISDEQVKAEEEAEEERVAAGDEDVSSVATPAVKAKFDPPTSPGLHLGYAQLPGGKPNGDYIVAEMAHLLHAWEKPTYCTPDQEGRPSGERGMVLPHGACVRTSYTSYDRVQSSGHRADRA